MFLNHFEGIFMRSAHLPVAVQNVVASLFQGQLQYVTTCAGCQHHSARPSPFYELVRVIIPLAKRCT